MTVGLALTPGQFAALDRVSEDCKVVMAADGGPVLQHPDGQLVRVTHAGRVVAAAGWMEEDLDCRTIDMVRPLLP